MDRAYSTLTVKASNDDQRTFEGIASTPSLDSQGDVMEPFGAQFSLPIPLLWQHDSKAPIGHVTHATVTEDGIHVKASITRIPEPGTLRDRLDEAWHSVKHGLVKGLSIGFRVLEAEAIRGKGKHIKSWDWRELSCVTMAANVEASILAVKRADQELLEKLGMVPAMPISHADNDMSVADLLAQLGTERFIVAKQGGALVLEMLHESKPAPFVQPQQQVVQGVSKAFLEAVMSKVMTELGNSSAASRLMLIEKINHLERRVRKLEGEP